MKQWPLPSIGGLAVMWQACPQLAEADIRVVSGHSVFRPTPDFGCAVQPAIRLHNGLRTRYDTS